MTIFALIPARAGSTRVADKNGRPFAGTSLIEIAITTALRVGGLDHVALSTDSDAYLATAGRLGLGTDYRRPAELAGADTPTAACVLDYAAWHERQGGAPLSHVLLLQPTSPFRTARQIEAALALWRRSGKPSLVSATRAAAKPALIVTRDANGRLERPGLAPQAAEYFTLDGAIYITPLAMIRDHGRFWDEASALYVTDYPCPHDIDTEADFAAAAALFAAGIGYGDGTATGKDDNGRRS
jgi:CMP-N,N'-diacetyllegionaminic acid synthase